MGLVFLGLGFSTRVSLIGIIIAAIIIESKYLELITTELSLTSKKILGKVGVICTKVMDSPLNKINNISVEQGLDGKIVISTSSGSFNFKFISQPDVFRNAVMNQIIRQQPYPHAGGTACKRY